MALVHDASLRFSRRVNDYVKYRPGYPDELARTLRRRVGYDSESVIADVGSGTGISTQYFLDRGNWVYAIEPNPDMRLAAETWLGGYVKFRSIAARAAATTLDAGSVDLVVAAQSFHWFDKDAARREFQRILRPGSYAALVWNERKLDASPFLRAYDELLLRYSDDYASVLQRYAAAEAAMERFFSHQLWGIDEFAHHQSLDLEGFLGRALSSSYVPLPEHPNHAPLVAALKALFREHERGGQVRFEYATRLFWGRLT